MTVTVKQFSKEKIKNENEDILNTSDIRIYTLFRNHRCYHKDIRKVKDKTFIIHRNTAFQECLSNKYYFFNNIKDTDTNFHNQTEGFNKYYNCGVTAPIHGGNRYYGFLACDVLNKSFQGEIFDTTSGLIVEQYATNLATYIEYMTEKWEILKYDDTYVDFFEMNYKKILTKTEEKG